MALEWGDLQNLKVTCINLDEIDFPCSHDTECKSCSKKKLAITNNQLLHQLTSTMNLVRQNKFECHSDIVKYEELFIEAIVSGKNLLRFLPIINDYLKLDIIKPLLIRELKKLNYKASNDYIRCI